MAPELRADPPSCAYVGGGREAGGETDRRVERSVSPVLHRADAALLGRGRTFCEFHSCEISVLNKNIFKVLFH